jgi:hypothetical protein
MSHNLFAVFPLPVVLAFAALLVLLLVIGRMLAEMGKPVTVHTPAPAPLQAQAQAPAQVQAQAQAPRQTAPLAELDPQHA